MTKHTPTPWDYSGDGKLIVGFYDNHLHTIARVDAQPEYGWSRKANAAYIVKCVNLHDELVEALTSLATVDIKGHSILYRLSFSNEGRAVADKVVAVLAKAKAE